MAGTYLQRTESAGNRRTFTWSAWVKRSKIGSSQFLASCTYSSSDEAYFFFNGSDKLIWQSSSASYGDVQTNRVFRDTNSWYHIVLAVDTTQATESNRIRFYVNGVEETSFASASYPAQDTQVYWNVGGSYYPRIGRRNADSDYFDGYMSHVAHIDGTQELPTIFGSTDSVSGEWMIKTTITPSSGWGTNGYHILKDSNSVTDQSGQGNNWTVSGGTLTNMKDNPSNVFAVFNPLIVCAGQTSTITKCGTQAQSPTSEGIGGISSLGFSSGKYYAEFLYASDTSGSNNEGAIGVCDSYFVSSNNELGGSSSPGYQEYSVANWGLRNAGNTFYSSSGSKNTQTGQHGSWTINDIIGVAVDADNNKIYFSKNGGWWDGTSSWSGTSPTNYLTLDSTGFEGVYHFAVGDSSSGNSVVWRANFGNGYFGTTAITSAGTNASNIGSFEYDVPSGYTALCTKGLNT